MIYDKSKLTKVRTNVLTFVDMTISIMATYCLLAQKRMVFIPQVREKNGVP